MVISDHGDHDCGSSSDWNLILMRCSPHRGKPELFSIANSHIHSICYSRKLGDITLSQSNISLGSSMRKSNVIVRSDAVLLFRRTPAGVPCTIGCHVDNTGFSRTENPEKSGKASALSSTVDDSGIVPRRMDLRVLRWISRRSSRAASVY